VAALHDTFTNRQYTKYIPSKGRQYTKYIPSKRSAEFGKCGPCPVFVSYTLAFALQLRESTEKTSVRVAQYKNNEQALYKNNEKAPYQPRTSNST